MPGRSRASKTLLLASSYASVGGGKTPSTCAFAAGVPPTTQPGVVLAHPAGQYSKKCPQVDGHVLSLSARHAKLRREGRRKGNAHDGHDPFTQPSAKKDEAIGLRGFRVMAIRQPLDTPQILIGQPSPITPRSLRGQRVARLMATSSMPFGSTLPGCPIPPRPDKGAWFDVCIRQREHPLEERSMRLA